MKTKNFKISEVDQKWHLIDAENKTLGRLSSRVSTILMGKNKSQYTPNNDLGDFVVIINAEKIKLTGNKEYQKKYFRDFYLPSWEKAPFTWNGPKGNGIIPSSNKLLSKPKFLSELILCSEKLSLPFAYVRIDWYDCGECFYFGEITFHHDSGYVPILPKEWDYHYGEKLNLNNE